MRGPRGLLRPLAIATWLLGLSFCLSGCMSTRVVYEARWQAHSRATYEDYFDYYLFGLVGHPTLDVQKVCMDQKPYAVHRLRTSEDSLIGLFTLGIYTPATVRVWCGD